MREAKIVVGLNWGDEGKGATAAKLLRTGRSRANVLCNGGAQRGHTVSDDGHRIVFSHFGSGTIVGAPTYMSSSFIFNPMQFMKEWNILNHKLNLRPDVKTYHPLVSFPQDMLFNQFLEKSRGSNRHGSCGLGIWATMERTEDIETRIWDGDDFLTAYDAITEYYWERSKEFGNDELQHDFLEMIASQTLKAHFFDDAKDSLNNITELKGIQFLGITDLCVFEMGQGIELDQDRIDNYPHVSGSSTGSKNALAIAKEVNKDVVPEVYYVTRSYATRHGAGPLEGEVDLSFVTDMTDNTNVENEWQGEIRLAPLITERVRKNLDYDAVGNNSKKSLVITHLNYTDNKIITDRGSVQVFDWLDDIEWDGDVYASYSDSVCEPLVKLF